MDMIRWGMGLDTHPTPASRWAVAPPGRRSRRPTSRPAPTSMDSPRFAGRGGRRKWYTNSEAGMGSNIRSSTIRAWWA